MRQSAGDCGLPMGLPLHCRMHLWPRANVCMFNADLRDIFDADLPGDVESTEGAALDDVAWIVSLSWINREYFVVRNIHVGSQEIQEHEPCTDEAILINAGEETSKILNEICVNGC